MELVIDSDDGAGDAVIVLREDEGDETLVESCSPSGQSAS